MPGRIVNGRKRRSHGVNRATGGGVVGYIIYVGRGERLTAYGRGLLTTFPGL